MPKYPSNQLEYKIMTNWIKTPSEDSKKSTWITMKKSKIYFQFCKNHENQRSKKKFMSVGAKNEDLNSISDEMYL